MSQRKNTVQLSATVYRQLEQMVSNGEFASTDDAANFLLYQQMRNQQYSPLTGSKTESTQEYLPVLTQNEPEQEDITAVPIPEAPITADIAPKKSASDRFKMLSNSFD